MLKAMTRRTILLALLLLIGLGAAAALYYRGDLSFSGMGSATNTPSENTASTPEFNWKFEHVGEGQEGQPRTRVVLITNSTAYNLGIFDGSCTAIAEQNLLTDELAGVLCWWAGAGDEIGVFQADQWLVVRQGIQEEGTAESEGFRGNFTTLLQLN